MPQPYLVPVRLSRSRNPEQRHLWIGSYAMLLTIHCQCETWHQATVCLMFSWKPNFLLAVLAVRLGEPFANVPVRDYAWPLRTSPSAAGRRRVPSRT